MENPPITGSEGNDPAAINRLAQLCITDESSIRELKSLVKDALLRAMHSSDHEDDICHLFLSSLKDQLDAADVSNASSTEIGNALMFIRTLVEIHFTYPSRKESDDSSTLSPATVNGSGSRIENEAFSNLILIPSLPAVCDFIRRVLNQQSSSAVTIESATVLHRVLASIHKTLRTSLCVLKKIEITKICESVPADSSNHELKNTLVPLIIHQVTEFGQLLCTLFKNPSLKSELDIKCSIGLALCSTFKILYREEHFVSFFEHLFEGSNNVGNGDSTTLENEIVKVFHEIVNKIALAFGVLGVIGSDECQISLSLMKAIGEKYIIEIEHGTKEAVSLGSARILETWTKKLLDVNPKHYLQFKHLYYGIEFFIYNYLASHIDAVKRCCRNMIAYVSKIYEGIENLNPESNFLVRKFIENVLVKPPHVKWMGLSWITRSSVKSICLLEMERDIPEQILCTERIFKSPATETYMSLMTYHYDVTAEDDWSKTWIAPLFNTQRCGTNESNWPQKRSIICTMLKTKHERLRVSILKYIIHQINSNSLKSTEASQLGVEAIKIAAESEINLDALTIENSEDGSFRGVISRDILNSWLWCGNHQVRLATFSLIVETRKTSEPLSKFDLDSLKLFVHYNLVSQDPAFRQQFLSYFKKLLKRLNHSFLCLKKKKNTEVLQSYQKFYKWLWQAFTLDEGLYPGANFGRRCQALDCLVELIQHFDFTSLGVEPHFENVELLRWFNDSYENNKIMAFKVLERMPMPMLEDPSFRENLMTNAFTLCESVRPPVSVTGRYLVVFVMDKFPKLHSPISVLETLYDKLTDIFDRITKSSLMDISGETGIYGYLSCIRMIFKETKDRMIDHTVYRNYTQKLIEICFKLNKTFFPLLGCAAPEGTLIASSHDEKESNKDFVVRSLNAQKLLVCSWRSTRDSCLLMTEICSLFPLEGEMAESILNFDQVKSIGNHLLFLLKNLMHRGVFEQVFVGFKLLTTRLYRSTNLKFNKLIEEWLDDALDEEQISSKSTTRRSAGLPFILQALLTPGCNNDAFISKYVNNLFSKRSESPQVRIHIMNVLRSLFRDATFSRAMMPYVPAGLKLAFKAQASNHWPEQNSGLMLLGATVRRCFGPKLNTMSASTFFRKFPDMYEFLLDEIRSCSEKVKSYSTKNNHLSDFTFYVLVLLASFASKGVVEDAHFPLTGFVDCIRNCGASDDIRVRKVAAKAVLPFLVDPACQLNTLRAICDDLKTSNFTVFKVHGDLLMALAILQLIPLEDRAHDIISNFRKIVNTAIWQPEYPFICETLADICLAFGEIARDCFNIVQKKFHEHFGNITDRHSIMNLPNVDRRIFEATVFFTLSDKNLNSLEVIYSWAIKEDSLVFMEQLLSFLCSHYSSVFNEGSSSVVLNALIRRYVATKFLFEGQSRVEQLFLGLFSQIPDYVYNDWLNYVMEEDRLFPALYEKVLNLCEVESGTMTCKAKAVELIGKLTFKIENTLTDDYKERVCSMLCSLSDSSNYDEIRLCTAKALPTLSKGRTFEAFSVTQQFKLWYAFIVLSQDDECTVREEINSKYDTAVGSVCDIKLVEDLIELCFNNFILNHKEEGLVLLMGLVTRDDYLVTEADDSEEERLFDKSEMNSFFEPLQLAKALKKYLDENVVVKNDFKVVFESTKLCHHLVELYEFASNATLSPGEDGEITLKSLFSQTSSGEVSQNNLSSFTQSEILCLQDTVRMFITTNIFS